MTSTHVYVVNTTRNALGFRVPGRSVTLAPGESVELPRLYMERGEVRLLVKQGALFVRESPALAPHLTARITAGDDVAHTEGAGVSTRNEEPPAKDGQ